MSALPAVAATRLLNLGTDRALRAEWFSRDSLAHPAKLHLGLLQWLVERYTRPGDIIADPMAGIGSTLLAAAMQRHVLARDVETRWLALAHQNAAHIIQRAGLLAGSIDVGQADARQPWGVEADHIITSPPYACAAAVNPTSKGMMPVDVRRRLSKVQYHEVWRKTLSGDSPGSNGYFMFWYGDSPDQVGHLRGGAYWIAMRDIYTQARVALRPGGYMILVIKDHIKRGQRVHVADETVMLCEGLGFQMVARHARRVWPLSLWQRRRKERGEPIVEDEAVLVFTHAQRRIA